MARCQQSNKMLLPDFTSDEPVFAPPLHPAGLRKRLAAATLSNASQPSPAAAPTTSLNYGSHCTVRCDRLPAQQHATLCCAAARLPTRTLTPPCLLCMPVVQHGDWFPVHGCWHTHLWHQPGSG